MGRLDRLVTALPGPLQGITADSRQVAPGWLFVALRGETVDGHGFIPAAIGQGAIAIVGEVPASELPFPIDVPYLVAPNGRQALAYLSARWHGFPARRLVMIGVTGTDGKTTTTNLIYHILAAAGRPTGMISTVNAVLGDRVVDTGLHVTTPDAPAVQGYLTEMVRAGLSHCVLEATSHGLAQHRVGVCDFDVAVITNVTHEHLDYHGDYAGYRAAKAMLFESLSRASRKPGQPKVAVLNADDSSFEFLRRIPADRWLSYSLTREADLTARNLRLAPAGVAFELVLNRRAYPIQSHLMGRFNASNVLAAAAAALALEPPVPLEAIHQGVADVTGIPGRMELIDQGQPFSVVVDFAHTPNALQQALEAGRELVGPDHQVIAVFGSAGLRDVVKRRMMAQVAAGQADLTVLTAEDPRTEPLDAILSEMADGCREAGGVEGSTFYRVPDRMQAIHFALTRARPGDVVLLCGKGHEQSMCFGTVEYPWDDRQAARQAIAAFLAGELPPDSGLPAAA